MMFTFDRRGGRQNVPPNKRNAHPFDRYDRIREERIDRIMIVVSLAITVAVILLGYVVTEALK